MPIDYDNILNNTIKIVSPDKANSNAANNFIIRTGGMCSGKGGSNKASKSGNINTQLSHLEGRVTTLEHTVVGLYVTLSEVAKLMSESDDEAVKTVGEILLSKFNGTEEGLKAISDTGENSGKPDVPQEGRPIYGPGTIDWRYGVPGGFDSLAETSYSGPLSVPSGDAMISLSVSNYPVVSYSSFTQTLRSSTASSYNQNVGDINASQNLIRAGFSSSITISS